MKHSKKLFISFLWGTGLVLALWIVRVIYTGNTYYGFLLWNLFLAGIPFAITYYMKVRKEMSHLKWELCFVAWLLFLPNAPYLITDLIHLEPRNGIPLWYDAVILFAAALSGLWVGCISLLQMESLWKKQFPKIRTSYFTTVVLLLCGFGIYLGRMLRFNSWDVITDPFSLLQVIAHRVAYPWQYMSTWCVTIFFAGLMWVAFLQVKNLVSGKEKYEL